LSTAIAIAPNDRSLPWLGWRPRGRTGAKTPRAGKQRVERVESFAQAALIRSELDDGDARDQLDVHLPRGVTFGFVRHPGPRELDERELERNLNGAGLVHRQMTVRFRGAR
jgi:hypothetical protein